MQRRTLIKSLLLMTGGVTLLSACLNKDGNASVALRNIKISAEQEKLLAEIAATIIPQTDSPGAREVGAHLFVMKMLDDCYDAEEQKKFMIGLNELNQSTKQRFNQPFMLCSPAQREQMLLSIENNEPFAPEVFSFYKVMKAKTMQGYLTSEYVLVNIMKYEIIPSVPYNGYHLMNKNKS